MLRFSSSVRLPLVLFSFEPNNSNTSELTFFRCGQSVSLSLSDYLLLRVTARAVSSCLIGVSGCHRPERLTRYLRWSIYVSCYHNSPIHFKHCGYHQYRYIVTLYDTMSIFHALNIMIIFNTSILRHPQVTQSFCHDSSI